MALSSVCMKEKKFIDRYAIPWFAFGLTSISLVTVGYLKWVFTFEDGNFAQGLAMIAFDTAIVGTILGLFSIRRWQGIGGVILAGISLDFILFGRLWAIS